MQASVYSNVIPLLRTINPTTETGNITYAVSKILGFNLVDAGLTGGAIILSANILKMIYKKKIEPWREKRKEIETLRKELFPNLKSNTELFVGPRDYKTLNPSKEDVEAAAGTGILDFFARCDLKKNVKTYSVDDLKRVIFGRHLCSIGGPVPNPYVGLIMYKQSNWRLPFEYGPKIREYYNKDDIINLKNLKEDWYISKRKGDRPQFVPSYITLDDRTKRYEVDYGFIIKTPTVDPITMNPGAHISYSFSGCHWEGGKGAVEALRSERVLKYIYEIISDENKKLPSEDRRSPESTYFQAVIRCKYDHKHNKVEKVTPENIGIIKT